MARPTEDRAYTRLNIANKEISDGDVVASFYALYSQLRGCSHGAAIQDRMASINALQIIASYRQSRFLNFIVTIVPHLNEHNVGLLTTTPLPPIPYSSPLQVKEKGASSNATKNSMTIDKASATNPHTVSKSGPPSDEDPPENQISSEGHKSSSQDGPIAGTENNACYVHSTTEDAMDTSYDLSSKDYGQHYDGQRWRCNECDEPLADCCCLDGSAHQCATCAQKLDVDHCATYCSKCHPVEGAPCHGCRIHEGSVNSGGSDGPESHQFDELFWDGVWRCSECLWEVEANGTDTVYCHCATTRRIEVSKYPDIIPSDEDCSLADSTDTEPDSGDESFIEDDGPFELGTEDLLAGRRLDHFCRYFQ